MGPHSHTDLDRYTTAELDALHETTYRAAMAAWDKVDAKLDAMRVMPVITDQARAEYKIIDGTAKDLSDLLKAIGNTIRARKANADA